MSKAFQIYKASAGSGKTFTLVIKYLEILLSSDSHSKFRQILAITFTNKAAAEMKERIIGSLYELASKGGKSEQLFDILIPKLNLNQDEISKRAELALSEILHNYTDFSVTTIDKFVQKVVRSFSKELKLPYNYVVELDQEEMLQEAIERILNKIGQDTQLTDALLKLVMNQLNEDKKWKIDQMLFETGQEIFKDQNDEFVQSLSKVEANQLDEYIQFMESYLKHASQNIRKLAADTLDYIQKQGYDEGDFFQTRSGVYKYFKNASSFENTYLGMNSYVQRAYDNEQWQSSKPRKLLDLVTKEKLHENLKDINKLIEDKNIYTYKAILKNIYLFKIIRELNFELDIIQHQSEKIHISNFNKRIGRIVKSEPIPFIYERIGNKYKHLMIDEFQDTSVLQWENMLPLVENGLSEENYSLIVGDPKQAIYRWRGGEAKQFISLPYAQNNEYNSQYHSLIFHHELVNLKKNYRSDQEIIEFNNALYDFVSNNDKNLNEIFKEHQQEYNSNKVNGIVLAQIIDKEDYPELILSQMLNDIYELINVKKFQLGDIAILVRRNSDAALIAEFLLNNNLSVVTTDGLQLIHNSNCNAVLAWLSYLNNQKDLVSKASVLFDLHHREIVSNINEFIGDEKKLEWLNLSKLLNEPDLENLWLKPLSFIAETVVRILKIYPSSDIAVMTLLDMIYQFENKSNATLSSFLTYWNTKGFKKKIESSEKSDSIQIMTIHKSKGLQFPVVLLPFIQDNRRKKKSIEWYELDDENLKDLKHVFLTNADELRYSQFGEKYLENEFQNYVDDLCILYVATTRPEHALYIYLKSLPEKSSKSVDEDALSTLNELLIGFINSNQLAMTELNETTYFFGNINFENKKVNRITEQPANKTEVNEVFTKRLNLIEQTEEISQKRGNIFHQIMEKATSLENALIELNHYQNIEKSEWLMIKQYLESVFEHEQLSKWLTNKNAYSERDLVKDGKILRPDKVIFDEDKIIIIDFKTGSELESHVEQIRAYADTIQTIENKSTESYITYYNNGLKIVKA